MKLPSKSKGALLVKVDPQLGGRRPYLHFHLLDSKFTTVKRQYSTSKEVLFLELPYGNYELRLSTIQGVCNEYLVSIDESVQEIKVSIPQAQYRPIIRMDVQGRVIDAIGAKRATDPTFGDWYNRLPIPVIVWRLVNNHWIKESNFELDDFDFNYELIVDGPNSTVGFEFLSPSEEQYGQSRFLVIPPGRLRVHVTLANNRENGGEFVLVNVVFESEITNALVDLMQTGDVEAVHQLPGVIGSVPDSDPLSFESLIVACVLDLAQEFQRGWVPYHLSKNTAEAFSDASVFSAWQLIVHWEDHNYWDLVEHLLNAQQNVPHLSISLQMLYEFLCQLDEIRPVEMVSFAREQVGEWMRHLIKYQPFTMFRNYRPIEFTNSWEPVGGLGDFEGSYVPAIRR